MRNVFSLASLSVVTGFCLVQACGGDEEATPATGDPDAGQTSSSGATSSSGTASSSGGSSGTSSSGGTNDGGNTEAGTDAGKSKMTFFATSVGSPNKDGNIGGIAGADTICKTLATAKGGGDHTWAAYLSTNNEDAKDRIGAGPWVNQKGTQIAKDVAELHGGGFNIKGADILDESGAVVPADQHDMLTGTDADGTKSGDRCKEWTSNSQNEDANVGHSDSDTTGGGGDRWNNAHATQCNAADIASKKGAGRFYCFAKD